MARVLVVEDDVLTRALIVEVLQKEHVVIAAMHGKHGLEKLAQNPDIILCDYHMPEMNGYEFSRTVRREPTYSAYALIPIIGIGEFPADKMQFINAFHPKPFRIMDIPDWIKTYCPLDIS